MRFKYLIIFTINLFVIALIIKLMPAKYLNNIRDALFSIRIDKIDFLNYNDKDPFKQFEFKKNDIFYINDFKKRNNFKIENKANSFLDSVFQIANSFSKGINGSGCGDYSDNIIKNLNWVSKKNGCCSDFSQCLIATCLISGINVREVYNRRHVTNEVFYPKINKWIFIDAHYHFVATTFNNDKYLNSLEIFDYYQKKIPINFHFFGSKESLLNNETINSHLLKYTDPKTGIEGFSANQVLIFPNGNNVFEVDYYNQKLIIFPRWIRQFIFILVGIQPSYYVYDPSNLFWPRIIKNRGLITLFLLLLIGSNFIILTQFNKISKNSKF